MFEFTYHLARFDFIVSSGLKVLGLKVWGPRFLFYIRGLGRKVLGLAWRASDSGRNKPQSARIRFRFSILGFNFHGDGLCRLKVKRFRNSCSGFCQCSDSSQAQTQGLCFLALGFGAASAAAETAAASVRAAASAFADLPATSEFLRIDGIQVYAEFVWSRS